MGKPVFYYKSTHNICATTQTGSYMPVILDSQAALLAAGGSSDFGRPLQLVWDAFFGSTTPHSRYRPCIIARGHHRCPVIFVKKEDLPRRCVLALSLAKSFGRSSTQKYRKSHSPKQQYQNKARHKDSHTWEPQCPLPRPCNDNTQDAKLNQDDWLDQQLQICCMRRTHREAQKCAQSYTSRIIPVS